MKNSARDTRNLPVVKCSHSGSKSHWTTNDAEKNFPVIEEIVAIHLSERDYLFREKELWECEVAGIKPATSHNCRGQVKIQKIIGGRIELSVQWGDRDEIRTCYLTPPAKTDVDTVFERLHDWSSATIAELKLLAEFSGANIEALKRVYSKVEDPGGKIGEIRAFWSNEANRFALIESFARDKGIQFDDERLCKSIKRFYAIDQTTLYWELAIHLSTLAGHGVFRLNQNGFVFEGSALERLEGFRQAINTQVPEGFSEYVHELRVLEQRYISAVSNREKLQQSSIELRNQESELIAGLEANRVKQEKFAIQLREIEESLVDPKVLAATRQLDQLRKDIDITKK